MFQKSKKPKRKSERKQHVPNGQSQYDKMAPVSSFEKDKKRWQ